MKVFASAPPQTFRKVASSDFESFASAPSDEISPSNPTLHANGTAAAHNAAAAKADFPPPRAAYFASRSNAFSPLLSTPAPTENTGITNTATNAATHTPTAPKIPICANPEHPDNPIIANAKTVVPAVIAIGFARSDAAPAARCGAIFPPPSSAYKMCTA